LEESPDIMQLVLDEMQSRGTYKYETYAPYYVCSYAMHAFNIMNQGRKVYWESKKLPNLRLHIVFVAPPGGMKSYFLSQMGGDDYSIFNNVNYTMNMKSNMNEATFVGSYVQQQNRYVERVGEARRHSHDFILIDEFKALMDALKSNFNSQFGTQLLNGLDHGNLAKDVVGGPTISYKTYFTLWGGIQPAKFDLTSGLGRRLCFLLNIPTKDQKKRLGEAIWESRNKRPDTDHVQTLSETINNWSSTFDQVNRIDYDHSVFELYSELDIEPYMYTCYDRLILGYHLAKGHIESNMCLDIEDKDLYNLIMQEYKWRMDIDRGPDLIQVANLIKEYGFQDENEPDKWYIKVATLNTVCHTCQMSIANIHEKIEEMKKYGMVSVVTKGLLCLEGV